MTGIKPQPQMWEARVLPLCHCGPLCDPVGTGYSETEPIIVNVLSFQGVILILKVNQFQYPGTEKWAKHHRKCQGVSKTKVGMPWCTGRF